MAERRRARLLLPLAGILLLAVAWALLERNGMIGPDMALRSGEQPAATPQSRVPGSAPRIYYGPPNSVAVLPFADRSPAGGDEALARGFAAEVQGRLEAVPSLQVTATRSSFFFDDPQASRRIVAERLKAAYLLHGDWRPQDGLLEVTATLFDARRGRESWSREFSGSLDRIEALRDAIARDVLEAMARTDALPPAPDTPADHRAWAALQQARYLADPLGAMDLQAAESRLREALGFEPAYDAARLALAELLLHPSYDPAGREAAVAEARQRIGEVLENAAAAPADLAQAWGLQSHLLHDEDWRWRAAADAADRALELRPGDAGLLALASLARFSLGDLAQAVEWLEGSIRRDPLNLGSRLRLGLVQEFAGRYDEALASYRQLLALREDYPAAHAYRARVKVLQGKAESALREVAQESHPFWKRYAEILALVAAQRQEEAESGLGRMIAEDGEVAAFQVAEILAFAGEIDRAFEWLERARERRDGGLSAVLGNPLLQSLHEDDRWERLLQQLGLPAENDGAAKP